LTKEGQTLLSNATDKFDCPLKDNDCISLCSGGHDYQKLKDNLLCCSQRFGYQHLLTNLVTNCIVMTAMPAVLANLTAVPLVLAVSGVSQSVTYSNSINVLEVYLDKLLDITQKMLHCFGGINCLLLNIPKKSLNSLLPTVISQLVESSMQMERKSFNKAFFPK
jgi:hypothetical protein